MKKNNSETVRYWNPYLYEPASELFLKRLDGTELVVSIRQFSAMLLSRTDFSRTRTLTWGLRTSTRTQISNVEAPVK